MRSSTQLGDLVSVRELSADGTHFEQAIVRHADPAQRASPHRGSARGAVRSPVTRPSSKSRPATTVLIPHLRQDKLRQNVDPELIQYLDEGGVHSLIAVPAFVRRRGRRAGRSRPATHPGGRTRTRTSRLLERAASIVGGRIARARLADGSCARRRALVDSVTQHPRRATHGVRRRDRRSHDCGYGEIICDPTGRVVADQRCRDPIQWSAALRHRRPPSARPRSARRTRRRVRADPTPRAR